MTLEVPAKKLHIPMEVVVPKILELGLIEKPKEACGVIVPELSTPPELWVLPLINRAANSVNSYEIDPHTIKDLVYDLTTEERVWENVVIWHTHPSGFVGPSEGDMRSRIEGLKYLVVSLPRGEAVMY